MHPALGGSLTAELSVPQGKWRIWAERGVAAWLGHNDGHIPRINGAAPVELDLPDAIRNLHARGLWCLEVRLLDEHGWSRPMDAYDGLSALMHRKNHIEAVSGIFSNRGSSPARVELHTDGRVLADNPSDAERWLLVAHDLDGDD